MGRTFGKSQLSIIPKLECYITLGRKGFARDKHSGLLGPCIIYEENKVLLIRFQVLMLEDFILLHERLG
jgi:hypothetical protein